MKTITYYWDIISGIILGIVFAVAADFELEKIQLIYSIIILILVSIGCCRLIKQSLDTNKKKKKERHNVIDNLIDFQKPVKAISLAQDPTKEGSKVGEAIINLLKKGVKSMKKLKVLFDKFKGYILTIALTILSFVEMAGGYINDLCGDVLVYKNVEILPLVTLIAAIVVGCISNGFTKDQKEKIKALFSKSSTNELVQAEIKKTLKEDETKLKEFNKILVTQENALDNLKSQLASAKNTHSAKVEMHNMTPQLATDADVQLAATEVVNIEAAIVEKTKEIEKTKTQINNLTTTINALKNQL